MSFGRLERTQGAKPMSDINMTPLIDVMLVLLVIFIITAPLLASSIKLDLPKTDAAQPGQAPQFVTLAVDARGQAYLNDTPLGAEALALRLQEVRLAAQKDKDFAPVDAFKARLTEAGVVVQMRKDGVDLAPGASFDPAKLAALE